MFPGDNCDSGTSKHVVCLERFLTDMEEITPVMVQLAYGTSVTARKRGIAELEVKGP